MIMTRLTPAVFALLGCTLAATAALAAVPGDTPSAPQPAMEVGDRDLSCKALAEKFAGLEQAQTRKADQAVRSRRMFGFATAALQMAAPLAVNLGGGSDAGGLISAVAQQGAMAAMQGAAASPAETPGGDPSMQRRERLTALFEAKGC